MDRDYDFGDETRQTGMKEEKATETRKSAAGEKWPVARVAG